MSLSTRKLGSHEQGGDFAAVPEVGYEEWRAVVCSIAGRYNPVGIDPNAFAGRVQVRNLFGLGADRFDCNAHRIERTQRDVRLDDVEFYHAVFQVVGSSTVLQNDQAVTLDVGDVALVDSTRPATYVNDAYAQWLSVQLPRRSLISHLGLEPQGGSGGRRGTRAGRLFFQLVLDEFKDEVTSAPASVYMQLAVYDLIGEIFTPPDPKTVSLYTDKHFGRLCAIIKDRLADPDFGPCEVAAEAGISLRYVQKLFTERGSTCSEFIYSVRLDHAARLLHRRALLGTSQPLSEIAYGCGFRDYTHFARKFRQRFSCAPGAHAGGHGQCADNELGLICPFVCGFASSGDSVTGPAIMAMGKAVDCNSP
jgi:AraC family transcriptional activator of tynA and feaB